MYFFLYCCGFLSLFSSLFPINFFFLFIFLYSFLWLCLFSLLCSDFSLYLLSCIGLRSCVFCQLSFLLIQFLFVVLYLSLLCFFFLFAVVYFFFRLSSCIGLWSRLLFRFPLFNFFLLVFMNWYLPLCAFV